MFIGWVARLVGNEGINLYIGILGMKLPSFPTKGQLVGYHIKKDVYINRNIHIIIYINILYISNDQNATCFYRGHMIHTHLLLSQVC